MKFAKTLGNITMRFKPEKLAMDRLQKLLPKRRDLRTRNKKKTLKEEWLRERD